MSRSPMQMVPDVTVSSPATMRRIVDFPDPEPPTSTSSSPSVTTRLKSSTMVMSPNRLVTRSKVMAGIYPFTPAPAMLSMKYRWRNM